MLLKVLIVLVGGAPDNKAALNISVALKFFNSFAHLNLLESGVVWKWLTGATVSADHLAIVTLTHAEVLQGVAAEHDLIDAVLFHVEFLAELGHYEVGTHALNAILLLRSWKHMRMQRQICVMSRILLIRLL